MLRVAGDIKIMPNAKMAVDNGHTRFENRDELIDVAECYQYHVEDFDDARRRAVGKTFWAYKFGFKAVALCE